MKLLQFRACSSFHGTMNGMVHLVGVHGVSSKSSGLRNDR